MSSKAIKKRSHGNRKHLVSVSVPVQPLADAGSKREPRPLPQKTFPLNKFIALPQGLKPKSSSNANEVNSSRRTTPIKAVGIPSGSSLYDSRAHVYLYGQPEGNTSQLTSDAHLTDDKTDQFLHNIQSGVVVNGTLSRTGNQPMVVNGAVTKIGDHCVEPAATSTPRAGRKSPSPAHENHSNQISPRHRRGSTPTGSITSVDSDTSGKRRYKKRSQSEPPDSNRRRLAETDAVLDQWTNWEAIPGLTRNVSYEVVHDGVTIQSENWTTAKTGRSRSGARHTIYRSNSVNSGHSGNTAISHNTRYTSSVDSTSELEFTDVCNLNTSNNVNSTNASVKSLDFSHTRSDTYSGFRSGVNTSFSDSQGDGSDILDVETFETRDAPLVRAWSDFELNSRNMDSRNMAQLTLPRSYAVNGAPKSGLVIYRHDKGERILVNDMHPGHDVQYQHGFYTVGRKQGTLMQSKQKFSSMPTLVDSKGDKKLMKLLKKQEKEEKKRKEKEEKKRAKEEKKRIKMEKKLKTKTLPRNFAYQQQYTNGHVLNSTMDKYRRPMLSLSAVPIDFEDGPGNGSPAPKMAPPPPPGPSERHMALYASAPDLQRLEQVYGATLRGVPKQYAGGHVHSDFGPRTVVLQRAPEGYGFVLRGAKSQLKPNGDLDFRPTPEFPALQYLDSVDPGSASDRAGLKAGDFILEINGENVVRASHDRVVHLIRGTGDTLAMKVVTVKPSTRTPDWFQTQQEKTLTMPNRKKKAAPAPPQRDPRTSLSYSKAEGQAVSEEIAVMEKLDQAIGEEKKTASIRSRTAAKRVSVVQLENIGVVENGGPGKLERAKSTPDLLDSKAKTIYATPTVPSNSKSNVYAVPGVNTTSSGTVVTVNAGSGVRPKAAPPAPPPENASPRKQAPKPPAQTGDIVQTQTEVVSINRTDSSPYASTSIHVKKEEKAESPYESSFRPGVSAKLSDEPPVSDQMDGSLGHRRTPSAGAILVKQTAQNEEGEKPNVSFAEDKVLDNAANFLKKHPNAQLLITADEQSKVKKRTSRLLEPEPDYDDDSEEDMPASPMQVKKDTRQSVTVISVGNKKETANTQQKRYTIHSTIPSEEKDMRAYDKQSSAHTIPPRPDGPAPSPPNQSPRQMSVKSMAPSPPSQAPPLPETAPPPLPSTPPPDFDESPSPKQTSPRDEPPSIPPPAPPAPSFVPPAPPAPPAPPPPPSMDELKKQKSEVKVDAFPIPQDAIAAAVAKRQERIAREGYSSTAPPKLREQAKTPMDSNQAAILAAVANRRKKLEQESETAVIDAIESRLQKTKKLQAAKFNITGSKNTRKDDDKEDIKPTNAAVTKSNTTVQSTVVKQHSEAKQTVKSNDKPAKEINNAKPVEVNVTVRSNVVSAKSTSGMTEIKPKFGVKPLAKSNVGGKSVTSSTVSTKIKQESLNMKPEPLEKTVSSEVETKSRNSSEISADEVKNDMNGQSNFLALAEKKRQEWLQRKQKSPSESKSSTPRSSIAGSPDRDQFRGKSIEIKTIAKKDASPPVSTKPKTNISVKGATTDHSYTEFQSSKGLVKVKPLSSMNGDSNKNSRNYSNVPPPPPGFRDGGHNESTVVQLEIIPPPANFSSSDSSTDVSHQHSPAFSPDNASVVSSLSTLSSLSGEQNDNGRGNGYEDLIAPPPPGFDDDESIPSVIPPPPEFGNEKKFAKTYSDKTVDTWLCNDVLDWLDSLSMGQYKSSFQQNCIDGKKLLNLTRNNYIDLGVTQVGHRMTIERSIKKAAIKQNTASKDIIASEHL